MSVDLSSAVRGIADVVDTHCHVSPGWYEPVEVLLFQLDRCGVRGATLVQLHGQYDNEYLFQCVERQPDRLAAVVLVDPLRTDALAEVERLAARGARGIRLKPGDRSAGPDPLAIWRRAGELGLPVSCGGEAGQLASAEFSDLVAALPDVTVVIEHLGSINFPDGEAAPYPIRRKVFELARYPNTRLKIHGLGEFAPRALPVTSPFPFADPIPPLLEMAVEAFGPYRLLWGSDYPPVSAREGYANALRFTLERLSAWSESERAAIFAGNARRLYKF